MNARPRGAESAMENPCVAGGAPVALPVLTAEIFSIPIAEGRYVVYAPLRRAAFVATARVVNFLADLREGRLNRGHDPDGALVEFLRRLEIVDAAPEQEPVTQHVGDPTPTAVTLFLTTACNLRCSYCYASAGDAPARFMSLDVARRGIDFVIANALSKGEPGIEIAFHGGGEPSVNWATMTGALRHAQERTSSVGLALCASTATNGVLSARQADWIIEHLQSASVSFDGLPEVQDLHRPMVAGGASSERVMATLRRFDAAGFDYGIRITVPRDQIPRLPDSVAFVFEHFSPSAVQVEPSYQLGRWRDAPSAETTEFVEAFREARRRAQQRGRDIRFSAARVGTLTNHFCGVSQDSFALTPDGNVSACYEAFAESNPHAGTFFYGRSSADGRFEFDGDRVQRLRGLAVEHNDWCRGCFARWHCAGDCHHKTLATTGPGMFQGTSRCHVTRALTIDQILERIHESGGWFWHEAPHQGNSQGTMGGTTS